ncbi:hypothetical protein SDC9_200608 [bioreactor metagenome]|uniref:Uncharacterized protein n=1 Tax=bioreactor metagenome TaxID=1076179 RepID=A0A645INM5_9ZZZZ
MAKVRIPIDSEMIQKACFLLPGNWNLDIVAEHDLGIVLHIFGDLIHIDNVGMMNSEKIVGEFFFHLF